MGSQRRRGRTSKASHHGGGALQRPATAVTRADQTREGCDLCGRGEHCDSYGGGGVAVRAGGGGAGSVRRVRMVRFVRIGKRQVSIFIAETMTGERAKEIRPRITYETRGF